MEEVTIEIQTPNKTNQIEEGKLEDMQEKEDKENEPNNVYSIQTHTIKTFKNLKEILIKNIESGNQVKMTFTCQQTEDINKGKIQKKKSKPKLKKHKANLS